MHSSKTLKSILCTILSLLLCISVLYGGYYGTDKQSYMDNSYRQKLSGTLDTLIIGASHAWNAFIPEILDKELDCNSYNLSNGLMPMHARKVFLEKEIARNQIHTVVLEITYDALTRSESSENAEGDEMAIARLDNMTERFNYLKTYVPFDNWTNIFSRGLIRSVQTWMNILTFKNISHSQKGYLEKPAFESIAKKNEHHVDELSLEQLNQETVAQFSDIIKMCQKNKLRTIIVVTPCSNKFIWKRSGLNEFWLWQKEFCEKEKCELYDFNLLKNKDELFNDRFSYFDEGHLSHEGAHAFSDVFCDVIKTKENERSQFFYEDYKIPEENTRKTVENYSKINGHH